MQSKRLHLYTISMKYVRDLARVDDKVMSVSPQENKEKRPFVGVVVILESKKYCIPLTSPKPKHKKMKNDLDFSKMYDANDKFIGALNFNNMIPVSKEFIISININPNRYDSPKDKIYKDLLNNQTPEKSRNLTRRCCDFKKLEQVLERKMAREQFEEQDQSNNQTQTQPIIYPHKGGGRR